VGDIADQAVWDLAAGLALNASPLGMGASGWVMAQPGQDDQVECLVELAVAEAVAAPGRSGR
jgi:hypothetical protein